MSLITQCPACATMFRVVPDQLRISDGWVRCGQCDEVFDANAHLRTLEELQSATAHAPLGAEIEEQTQALPPAEPAPEPQPPSVATPEYDWGAPAPAMTEATPLDALPPDPDPSIAIEVSERKSLADKGDSDGVTEAPTEGQAEPLAEPEASVPGTAGEPTPSFMAVVAKPAPAMQGLGTKSLLALCSLLVAMLAAQGLWLHRDQLAVTAPALRPLLLAGCELLACKLQPLRQIESIAIDSSAFTSVRPGVYLLKVNLKNNAALELATPALELTLTDAQDRPLLRRVLQPMELSSKPDMAGASELGASLPIAVEPGATPEKIAGYKLLAFYP